MQKILSLILYKIQGWNPLGIPSNIKVIISVTIEIHSPAHIVQFTVKLLDCKNTVGNISLSKEGTPTKLKRYFAVRRVLWSLFVKNVNDLYASWH